MLRLRIENCYLRAQAQGDHSGMGHRSKKDGRDAQAFCKAVTKPRRHRCRILAIEKFHQFRDHLVRRLFHQPVAPAFDQDALDIGGHHPALLDQKRTAGLSA